MIQSGAQATSIEYLYGIFSQYGHKWRIMIFHGDFSGQMISGNDNYVYYTDSTGLNDYLDMLQEFYNDRDTVQPTEVTSIFILCSPFSPLCSLSRCHLIKMIPHKFKHY